MSVKLLTEHHLECLRLKEAVQARLSLHLSKCHIVGNHMSRLICVYTFQRASNKDAGQTALMYKLLFFLVLRMQRSRVFAKTRPIYQFPFKWISATEFQ